MSFKYVYEQDYLSTGWPDEGGGALTMMSWFDRDVTDDHVVVLWVLEASLVIDGNDVVYTTLPITVEIMPDLFIDEDVFYKPSSVRGLTTPVEMLRNEIRRVR